MSTLENAEVLAGIEIVEELSDVENTEKLVAVVEELAIVLADLVIANEPADLEIDELGLVIVEELLAASALASGLEIK